MKLGHLFFSFVAAAGPLAASPWDTMPETWGPARAESEPEPFRMPAPGMSRAQRKRLYLRRRLCLAPGGLVVGHQPCSLAQAERYLSASGAGEQSKQVKSMRKNEEGWAMGRNIAFAVDMARILHNVSAQVGPPGSPLKRVPPPPMPDAEELVAHQAAGDFAQDALHNSLRKPVENFNRRLAAALNLKEGREAPVSAMASLPPAIEDLDLSDLAQGEPWQEFAADYQVSRREGVWYAGEIALSQPQLASWLSLMGYNKSAMALTASRSSTQVMQAVAEYNARVAPHLEVLARAANPVLFPKPDGGPILPANGRKDGAPSPRELENQ